MDEHISCHINKAHYFGRKAEKAAAKGLFDEACTYHEQAACSLVQSLKLSSNEFALESLDLQIQYHTKYQKFLRLKKIHHQVVQEAARAQKEAMSRVLKTKKKSEAGESDETLQKAIYRTFEEADSLLELLVNKKENETEKPVVEEAVPITSTVGSKHPKDDGTVIEELRIVNCQLRSLITQLMSELAESERQVVNLKQRVAELEASQRLKPSADTPTTSFCDELSSDLPPLDLPSFQVGFGK